VLLRARQRDEAAWAELTTAGGRRAARDRARLREQVTLAREALSASLAADVVIDSFDEGFRVTREGFEELIGDLAGRAAERTQAAIRAAGVDPRDLAGLYLAGGAAGTPLIARRLSSALGVRPRLRDDPKAAVALGALRAYAPPRQRAGGRAARLAPGARGGQRPADRGGEGGTVLRLAGPLDAAELFEFEAVPGAVA
jgi:Hsp70 protein